MSFLSLGLQHLRSEIVLETAVHLSVLKLSPLGFYCVINTESKVRRKGLISAYISVYQSITEGNRDRNSRDEPGGKNWVRGHGGVLFTGLLSTAFLVCFLMQPLTTFLGWHPQ